MKAFVLASVLCLCVTFRGGKAQNDPNFMPAEQQLFKDLLESYNQHLRPARYQNESVRVLHGVAIINIVKVDEIEQSITLQLWMRMLWRDYRLTWNPSEHDGITSIRLPYTMVWRPDIVLYNTATDRYNYVIDSNIVVYNSGDILWIPPMVVQATCRFDMTYFPFDEQECYLKFGSWTHDGFQVDLDHYEGMEQTDLSDYVNHHEWEITEAPAKKNVVTYPCCAEPFPDITYTIRLKRIRTYYMYMFIAPSVAIALLTPFIFLMSARQTQKFSLGGLLLVCMCLMLTKFDYVVPAAEANIPILGVFYVCSFVLLSLSLFLSIVTTNLAENATSTNHPPKWLRSVCLGILGRVLCVSYDSYSTLDSGEPISMRQIERAGTGSDASEDKASILQRRSNEIREWRLIAIVLDRLLFIIFLVITIICMIALLGH